jgi:hypothetical protein
MTLKVDLVHSGLLTMSAWDMSNKLTMVIAIIAIITVMTAATAGTQVLAKKHPKGTSAEERGAHDGSQFTTTSDSCEPMYINQPGKGFEFHSDKFNKNFIKGFCKHNGNMIMESGQTVFNCKYNN